MKGLTKFAALSATTALLAAAAIAQPPGLAGLVWLDNAVYFDLNAGNLATSGALTTTVSLGNPAPTVINKNPNTLDIQLNLTALTGIPNLPTVTLTGSTNAAGDVLTWTVGNVIIDQCVSVPLGGSNVNVLVKRILGGRLTMQATLQQPPFNDGNRDYYVRMTPIGGNAQNFLNIEAYAFCFESPFTRIDATVRDLDYIAYSGPIPEPASILALGSGLVSLVALRRRKR